MITLLQLTARAPSPQPQGGRLFPKTLTPNPLNSPFFGNNKATFWHSSVKPQQHSYQRGFSNTIVYEVASFSHFIDSPSFQTLFLTCFSSPNEKKHSKEEKIYIFLWAAVRKAERVEHIKHFLFSLAFRSIFCQRDNPDPNCSCHLHQTGTQHMETNPSTLLPDNKSETRTNFWHLQRPKMKHIPSKMMGVLAGWGNAEQTC